jgi:hypothetical protein
MTEARAKLLLALTGAPGEVVADVLGVSPSKAIDLQIKAAVELLALLREERG